MLLDEILLHLRVCIKSNMNFALVMLLLVSLHFDTYVVEIQAQC